VRYTYLGDKLTDAALTGLQCDPVRRRDGKCIVSQGMATALVIDAQGGNKYVVARRRLRRNDKLKARLKHGKTETTIYGDSESGRG
jgi:hypothetical protein